MTKHWILLFAAWAIALAASLSVLFIGEVMGQEPCILCWYQRAFMFPLAIILGLAVWRNDFSIWIYGVLLSVLGGVIAIYHSLLYMGFIPKPLEPCNATLSCSGEGMLIFGNLPLPILSVITFTFIAGLLLAIRRSNHHE